ncbi:hypothetical protein [Streptomyces prunicolor]|uniref:hypothetical protein n=1 Tax=Streptomyces prunicolor TaxID=67348 RepID=UPI00340256F4
MSKTTQQQTYDHIFGSGALNFPWWVDYKRSWEPNRWDEAPDGWAVAMQAAPDESEKTVTAFVNHWALIGAMNAVTNPAEPWGVDAGTGAARECRAFLFAPEQADFSADTADVVLQVAVFGSIFRF